MVIPGQNTSSQYMGNNDGAPPLPPPGGYRGAKRLAPTRGRPLAPHHDASAQHELSDRRRWLGLAALVVSVAFMIVLIIILDVGGAHTLYGFNTVAAQFAVLALVLIALLTPRARALGSLALAVCLIANVATVGAAGALTSAVTGNYENLKTDEQKFWEKYPGVKDQTDYLADADSVEVMKVDADQVLREVRTQLSDDFGFTWTEPVDEMRRPMRNGYGGESWYFTYTSEKWMTNEVVQGVSDKTAVINSINRAITALGHQELYSLTESGYRDDAVLEKMYGSADPTQQVIWEYATWLTDRDLSIYVQIVDLSKDHSDGSFRQQREDWNNRSGEPLEGVNIWLVSGPTMSEEDAEAFEELLKDY